MMLETLLAAGAFATANGIIPNPDAIRNSIPGATNTTQGCYRDKQNELYEELLKLGVVNSNVRLGDSTRLLEDVNFGETMTSDKGMRMLLKTIIKIKTSITRFIHS